MTEQGQANAVEAEEITLLDLAMMLLRHKWEILLSTLIAAGIGVGLVLQFPRLYMASVKIIQPTKSSPSTASAILAQLGGGGGGFVDVSGNTYVAMLKSDATGRKLVEILIGTPIVTANSVKGQLDVSFPAANTAIAQLVNLGILQSSKRRRNRIFVAGQVVALLRRGVE